MSIPSAKSIIIAAAVVICSVAGALAQGGPFMDGVIRAADARVGQSLWAVGYTHLCPTRRVAGCFDVSRKIRPMDQVKIEGFVTDPATGTNYVHLKKSNNGADGFMEANWRTWTKEDPKQTKCRNVSLQIGWSDDTVLRAMKCAPEHINSTTTQMRDREQWVFPGQYLYFEDGALVEIQRRY
jgi:hypothetical protein